MTFTEAKQRIRKCFHEADLFKVNANLRTKGEAETSRMCSGVFSILLIIFFTYIFVKQIVKLVNYESITSQEIFETVDFESPSAENIKMAMSPAWEKHSNWVNTFDVSAYLVSEPAANEDGNKEPGTNISLSLQPCTELMWQKHIEIYRGFQFKESVCIKNPREVIINSSNWLDKINYLVIQFKKCNNKVNKNCLDDKGFEAELLRLYKDGVNFGTFYLPDNSINTDSFDSVEQFIPLNHYLTFTNKTRMRISVYLGTYSVQTETSFWPLVENIENKTGYFIAKTIQETINLEIENEFGKKELYGDIYVYMTNIKKRYVRKVGKFDEVISYAGGLFGILIGLFSYCILYFNKYSYELVVAETAFNNDLHGSKVREKEFHFLKYIKYQFFSWVKLLFCCELNWGDCKKIQQSRNEANMYMEITSLFRRVQLFELLLSYIVDPDKYMLIELTEPQSIEKVKEKRLMIQYYQTIIDQDIAIKMQDVRTKNQSLQLYQKVEARRKMEENKKKSLVNGETEMKQDRKNSIMKNMKANLQIENKEFLQQIAAFPEIQERANEIQLKSQMKDIEKIFLEAYLALSKQKKAEMIEKIPYKIIHRLSKCATEMREQ